MEYFTNYWHSYKFVKTYNRKNRVDDEFQEYRCNKNTREWYIGNMRHRKNGPAVCDYINGKLYSMQWYYNGYKQNPIDRFTEVMLFETGQLMSIKLPPQNNTPVYLEYYKDENNCPPNRIHFMSFLGTDYCTNPYAIESVYYHKNGTISQMAFCNRVDYLDYITNNLEGQIIYEFTDMEPNGVYTVMVDGNTVTVEYLEGFREDKLSKCIFVDGRLVKTEYYDGLPSYNVPIYIVPIQGVVFENTNDLPPLLENID